MQMIWYLIQVAVVVFLAQLVLAPIVIYFTSKQSANPRFTPFDPRNPPLPLPLSYMQSLPLLEALGFTPVAHLFSGALSPRLHIVMTVYVNRTERACATVVHMLAEVPPLTRVLHTYTEFSTEYDDGHELNTSNSNQAAFFTRVPQKQIFRLPHLTNLQQLFSVHQALANRYFGGNKRLALPGQEIEELIGCMKRDLAREAIFGRLKLDHTGEWYRPTMRGAIYGTVLLIWPIGMLRRMRIRRQGVRLTQEILGDMSAAA
jgi:hypothetical protein